MMSRRSWYHSTPKVALGTLRQRSATGSMLRLLGVLLLWGHAPASLLGQSDEGEHDALRQAALVILLDWEGGELGHLSHLLVPEGVRMDLGGGERGALSPRQVMAALRDFRDGLTSRSATLARWAEVGGTPPRGFAEVAWEAVGPGGSHAVTHRLYFGFLEQEAEWRVSEIRLLR